MSQTLLEVDGIGMLFKSSAFFPILGVHILAGLVCVVTGIVTYGQREASGAASEMRDDLSSEPRRTRHLRRFFGGGALDGRPLALRPGGHFLRCVMLGTHGPKTKLADLGRHTHHFYGLLLHCDAHRLLRRGRRELTRSERVAPLNLLVLARLGRNAFHRARILPPPTETSACCARALKAVSSDGVTEGQLGGPPEGQIIIVKYIVDIVQ